MGGGQTENQLRLDSGCKTFTNGHIWERCLLQIANVVNDDAGVDIDALIFEPLGDEYNEPPLDKQY